MDRELQEYLTDLRAVVGYLGEHDQFDWWPSSFFVTGSSAFLSPVFPRTQTLAQVTGVSRAAARSHDERIGVGHAYHLFRLPEEMEQSLHRRLGEGETNQTVRSLVAERETALAWLREMAQGDASQEVGPVRVGATHAVYALEQWPIVAGYYWRGFTGGSQTYPYFSDGLS